LRADTLTVCSLFSLFPFFSISSCWRQLSHRSQKLHLAKSIANPWSFSSLGVFTSSEAVTLTAVFFFTGVGNIQKSANRVKRASSIDTRDSFFVLDKVSATMNLKLLNRCKSRHSKTEFLRWNAKCLTKTFPWTYIQSKRACKGLAMACTRIERGYRSIFWDSSQQTSWKRSCLWYYN
jgi:hypothetical protein